MKCQNLFSEKKKKKKKKIDSSSAKLAECGMNVACWIKKSIVIRRHFKIFLFFFPETGSGKAYIYFLVEKRNRNIFSLNLSSA